MTTNRSVTSPAGPQLVITREFNAPRELVWEAWTQPEQIKQWFRPDAELAPLTVKTEPRVGGRFRIQIKKPGGEFFTAVGTYREVKPPERLVFTWAWEKDGSEPDFGEVEEQETLIMLELRARGDRTEMLFKQENFLSDESRDRHQHGWTGCFDRLANHIQGKQ